MSDLSPDRLGKMTASMADVVMGDLNGVLLKKYVYKLAGERLHGDLEEDEYESKAMKRGKLVEPRALDWYEIATGARMLRQQFVQHPTLAYCAATPDAVIELPRKKVVEAKSPLYTTWAESAHTNLVPSEYRWQYKWQCWCYGTTECDFVLWHPKPTGMIIKCSVTVDEMLQMASRASLIEERIVACVEHLSKRSVTHVMPAGKPPRKRATRKR